MNNTIPNEWSFNTSSTASIIPWTSGQSFCPYSMDYCWDGYSISLKTTNWTLTRNSQSTIGYTNVQFTFFISMKTENTNINHNCYIEYMTDNKTWRIITHINQNTYGQTDIFNSWIGKSANNNTNVRIRLRSTSDNGTAHCYYNNLKLTGDPIYNGIPIHNFPTKYYTHNPTLIPILNPTEYPLPEPTPNPTPNPTILSITNNPSHIPTEYPTPEPTPNPTNSPTLNPIIYPTNPTNSPTINPLKYSRLFPSFLPTPIPTKKKSKKMNPTMYPTIYPTIIVAKATLINTTIVNVFSAETRFKMEEYIIIYSVALFIFVIIISTALTLICVKKKSKNEKEIIQAELSRLEKLMYKNGYKITNNNETEMDIENDTIKDKELMLDYSQTKNIELKEIKRNIDDEISDDDDELEEMYNNSNRNYSTHINNNEKQVEKWLYSVVKLPQYYQIFINNGFNSFDMIAEINKIQHLEYIGIPNKAHQIKLMNHIQKLYDNKCNLNFNIGETGE